jgi:hypothetical protein
MDNIRRAIATFSIVAILSSFVVSTALAGTFTDVPEGIWYADEVEALVDLGVIDDEGTFDPSAGLMRAEAAKYVILGAGWELVTPETATFTDVPADHPAFSYIETAVAHEFMSGYGHMPGYFGPDDTVTRSQYAKMAVEAFELPLYTPETPTFPDVTGGWELDYVETAAHNGVVEGNPDGTFAPASTINKAAGAAMTHRAVDPAADDTDDDTDDTDDDTGGDGGELTVEVSVPEDFHTVVPNSADYVPVMELEFTADGGDVDVTKLVLTRGGLSQNTDVDVMSVFVDGVQHGTNVSVNSNNTATLNLATDKVVVEDGETVTVLVTFNPASTSTTGDILQFSLADEDALVSDASSLDGDFPLESDEMSISTTTIGSYTIAAGPDNPSSDYNPEAGDLDVRLLQWKITASGEALNLESFTLVENGTAASTDYESLKVYDETNSKVLCEGDSWNASGKFTCLPDEAVSIGKGDSINFALKVDIKSGSGTTMSAKIRDSGAYGVKFIGDEYGYIVGSSSAWAGTGTAQTIAAGALVVTLSSSTPATGNVAAGGDDEVLVRYDVEAKGEDVTVTEFSNTALLGTATYDDLTNCTLTNETTAELVAGPVDAASATDDYIRFTDTFTLPMGINVLAVACDLASGMGGSETIQIGFDDSNVGENASGNAPDIAVSAKGFTTNDTITPTPASADILGKILTTKAGAISAITMTTPAADNIIPGTHDILFANLQADATASGEDVKLTTIAVTMTPVGAASQATDFQNVGVYTSYVAEEDCTGTNQLWDIPLGLCRLDSLVQPDETTVATADDLTFSLETPLVAKKGESAILKVYGDYKSGVGAGSETMTVDYKALACLSGTGASTGTTISDATCDTGTGQAMTYAAAGTLTTSWGSNPTAHENVVAGTTKIHYGDYKMIASDEDVILNSAAFTRVDGASASGADADFGLVHLYLVDGAEETFLQSAYLSSGSVTFDLQSAGVEEAVRTIVEDETAKLRLYADTNSTSAGATSGASDAFDIAATGDVIAVGAGSGTTINASAAVTYAASGNKYKVLRKSLPTIALDNSGLSTNLGNGTMKLLQFTVTADPAGDIALMKTEFDVTLNDAAGATDLDLSAVKIYDASNTSTAITLVGPAGVSDSGTTCADGAGAITAYEAQSAIVCAFEAEEIIAAGTSKTYYIEGTIAASATSDSIVTRLSAEGDTFDDSADAEFVEGDATGVLQLNTTQAKTGTESVSNWIWSDMSAGASHEDTYTINAAAGSATANDWTSGYLLKTLPSNYFSISRS